MRKNNIHTESEEKYKSKCSLRNYRNEENEKF